MLTIAIVDDDDSDVDNLRSQIDRYFDGDPSRYAITRFPDGETFLERYDARFDLVFLDIEMPGVNGMDVAYRLRMVDESVVLIFTTKVTQYAASGYEVDAIGYLVKPVEFYAFAMRMHKAERLIAVRGEVTVPLNVDGASVFLHSRDIQYVEVLDHALFYHTAEGSWKVWSSLKKAADMLKPAHFVSCSRYCLVNPAWVSEVATDTIIVGDKKLGVSQARRKALIQALARYHSGIGSGA